MLRILKGGILLFFIFFSFEVSAQNYINSPYTRYKIGDLINQGFATNQALGGTSTALRAHNQVNYLNPASYTSQDTNSFLFQIGFTGRLSYIKTAFDSDQSNNMNIEYLAVGFPVARWLNLSAGIVPYSRIQYAFREIDSINTGGIPMLFEYNGFGGFNEFYIGAGITLMDVISIGANFNYLFGSLDRTEFSYLEGLESYSALIYKESNLIASDFYTKLGVQFHPTIAEKHKIIVGATLDAKANINLKLKGQITRINTANAGPFSDSLYFNIDTLQPLELPNKVTFGLSYSFDDKLLVTGEYIAQEWSGTEIVQSNFTLGKYESYRGGIEYTPVPLKVKTRESYFKRIQYRAGGYYTKTYLNHNNNNISDMGVTLGVGLPIKNARKVFAGTQFNISYRFGIRGTTENGLIQENHQAISVGFTLHDFWFLKPKYD